MEENNSARRVVIFAVIIALFAIAVVALNSNGFRTASARAAKERCAADMKVVQGAAELYQYMMEKDQKPGTDKKPAKLTVDMLFAAGTLFKIPRCRANPAEDYSIKHDGAQFPPFEVTCSVHGDLSRQEGEHKEKGLDHKAGGSFLEYFIDDGRPNLALISLLLVTGLGVFALIATSMRSIKPGGRIRYD